MASRGGAAGMSRHAKRKSSKLKRPKTKLGLPDLDHSKSAVLDSLRSPDSKRGYRHAIDEFIRWYCSEPRLSVNKVVVTRYRIHIENCRLAPGTINGRLPTFVRVNRHPRMGIFRIADAMSSTLVSRAKCPVSRNVTAALGTSRLNASAPGGTKKLSFLPHMASNGG